jgi:uncharacterized protein YfaS (alpha-2-macroglobulin family)
MPEAKRVRRSRAWYYPWIPLALGAGIATGLVALVLFWPATPQAQGAPATPQAVAAFQTTEKLLFNVSLLQDAKSPRAGTLRVELVDADDKVVDRASREVEAAPGVSGHRFEFPAPKMGLDKLFVRCVFEDRRIEVPVKEVLLVKAHETAVSTGKEFFAGSSASLRATVRGVKSSLETIPLPGSTIQVRLLAKDGQAEELFSGKAGEDGSAAASFKVPKLPAGNYTLEVVTRSSLGEETLKHEVKLKTSPKVLLVTDKPLYQPGQVIHLRALALSSFDLTPVAGKDLTFEVEDAKGNKVFKKAMQTSEYGIASADFQLADEVNQGDYRIRALLTETTADKTVTVKPYVLPKFKTAVKADKTFYLPKEKIQGEVQVDYFFGKPVAGGEVKVIASTFDVKFTDFQTWEGKTDAQGHAKFDIQLPDSFVGQPLQKGDALVKLEVKVTDTADHSETVNKTFPVSDKPIRVSLIPEGGRVVPGIENRIFVAAIYPDGSPARCDVYLWQGQGKPKDSKPLAELKTNDAGLAEFRITPKAEQFRPGEWAERKIEMLGGQVQTIQAQKNLLDLFAEVKDVKGNQATAQAALTSEALGDNVLLRLDKAIYNGGDSLNIDIRTSAGTPTVYLDVVREGQVLLTKWLDVKDGKAHHRLDLPPGIFGTVEIHAYQQLISGEIIRDSRVAYVHSASELKIAVEADKETYLPGAQGQIKFQVTDAQGQPMPAALGVLIVDEAVYALQEMQPGLEKVYFTLQQELLKPQAQALYRPAENVDVLVRQPELPADKQQIAEVLLTGVKPKPPARWEIDAAVGRKKKFDEQLVQIGWALGQYVATQPFQTRDEKTGTWKLQPDLLSKALRTIGLPETVLDDPLGGRWTVETLVRHDSKFTAERLALVATRQKVGHVSWTLSNFATGHPDWFKDGKWNLPEDALLQAVKLVGWNEETLKDAWGNKVRLVKLEKKQDHGTGQTVWDHHQVVSAGPDGKFGTADDVVVWPGMANDPALVWWLEGTFLQQQGQGHLLHKDLRLKLLAEQWGALPVKERAMIFDHTGLKFGAGGAGGPPGLPALPPAPVTLTTGAPTTAPPLTPPVANPADPKDVPTSGNGAGGDTAGGAPVMRLREYFPETLLWQPALITDDKGRATLPLTLADSITTWRMSASASSKGGLLGGTTAPLRVFQDFFVDIDLPVALTQNDEVAFPVAVYNYLKTPQTVKLELEAGDWFELTDGLGLTRSLEVKPGDVTGVKFRIRATRIGHFALTVKATGRKMSDAVKRSIEVVPDGQKVEQVASDRLAGTVTQKLTIPGNAIPDASKLFVKVYPGVFSQLLEGADGILRMPGGCFEQTSSSAYPNILAADYIKKTGKGTPAILMKAESYLNAGYQRLLTFERPGGGFDWWGSGEPLIWLTAYGLNEFSDMSKVWPVDRGVIERSQAWLMRQREPDGTWSKIGATHSESIERMGDARLLLTSYVCWALLESGYRTPDLSVSIAFIRERVQKEESTYILAMAANALASWDAKDDSTHEVLTRILKKLDAKKKDMPEMKACCFPAPNGQSLNYARGDCLTIETTAMTVLAMLKNGQFNASVNQALMYLVKSKDAHGTWGSTQATILALKALVASAGGATHKGTVAFAIKVNGKQVAKGEVTEKNADVMQLFELKDSMVQSGSNEVTIEAQGESNLMYQVVSRHFEPWDRKPAVEPSLSVSVDYDRTALSTADLLRATATLRCTGKEVASMVMLDLGIPPGFNVDAGDFAEMVGAKKVKKYSVTSRQVLLYLEDLKPGDVRKFEYSLKPKYPIKAKTPATAAYEYYTPANRTTAAPTEITVTEK